MKTTDILKRYVAQPVLMVVPLKGRVSAEMKKFGWDSRLNYDEDGLPEYLWTRQGGYSVLVTNLGYEETPPTDDAVYRDDLQKAKRDAVRRMLGLQ